MTAQERAAAVERPLERSPRRDLAIAIGVTVLASALSWLAPAEHDATVVGAAFLGASWWLVLRGDAASIRAHGLSLGGLLEPSRLEVGRLARASARAIGWALAAGAVTWPFFVVGFPLYYGIDRPFAIRGWSEPFDLVLGQLLVIALPEEAFFRGFLQTRLDRAWPATRKLLGVPFGASIVASSALFALAHVATQPHPARLAVFFPSLLFGWLRGKTGGIGAAVLFHAACNLLSHTLREGFG
jgi:membrane protease YdiL (CAAX protease family)